MHIAERGKPHGEWSDEALMRRVAAADAKAFDVIYRRYAQRVRHFLKRITRQPALADDALSETMLVVWCRARSFDLSSQLSTWMFAIAYRKGLQNLRRSALAARMNNAANDALFEAEPDAVLQRAELMQQVSRALTALSSDHRTVLRLAYFHGYACRDIARVMQCPVDTVKTRAFHARRKLRKSLAAMRNSVA